LQVFFSSEFFYGAIFIATMELCLRRSVHRSVILIITFDVYNRYQLFFIRQTHPGRLNSAFINFAPPLAEGDGLQEHNVTTSSKRKFFIVVLFLLPSTALLERGRGEVALRKKKCLYQ
jgi:hypothetical protein